MSSVDALVGYDTHNSDHREDGGSRRGNTDTGRRACIVG